MSEELRIRIQQDLNAARKDRDKLTTVCLTTLLSEIRNREIEEGGTADDPAIVEVVSRAIKQRRDSADQMRDAGREELAEKEEREIVILERYLPPQLSEEEVRALVREAIESGADQMGPLMGRVMPKLKGRFPGKEANRIVREELGQG